MAYYIIRLTVIVLFQSDILATPLEWPSVLEISSESVRYFCGICNVWKLLKTTYLCVRLRVRRSVKLIQFGAMWCTTCGVHWGAQQRTQRGVHNVALMGSCRRWLTNQRRRHACILETDLRIVPAYIVIVRLWKLTSVGRSGRAEENIGHRAKWKQCFWSVTFT